MDSEKPGVNETPEEAVEHFWEDPNNVLRLIDLIFFCDETRKDIPS